MKCQTRGSSTTIVWDSSTPEESHTVSMLMVDEPLVWHFVVLDVFRFPLFFQVPHWLVADAPLV